MTIYSAAFECVISMQRRRPETVSVQKCLHIVLTERAEYFQFAILSIPPSIQSSSSCHLSGFESMQTHLALPLPGHHLWHFKENTLVLPSHQRVKISLVYVGSARVSSQMDTSEALHLRGTQEEASCPNSLNWLPLMWRSGGCTPNPSSITELFTLSDILQRVFHLFTFYSFNNICVVKYFFLVGCMGAD